MKYSSWEATTCSITNFLQIIRAKVWIVVEQLVRKISRITTIKSRCNTLVHRLLILTKTHETIVGLSQITMIIWRVISSLKIINSEMRLLSNNSSRPVTWIINKTIITLMDLCHLSIVHYRTWMVKWIYLSFNREMVILRA